MFLASVYSSNGIFFSLGLSRPLLLVR